MVSPANDPMMAVWDAVAQSQSGGKFIIWRNRNDLDFLYESGFVDTHQFTKEKWIESFKDSLRPDGSYRVTLEQWMAKRPYRYSGPVEEPLDPASLREGEWELAEFETLLKEKILPSTTIAEEQIRKGIEKARKTAIVNGKFLVNKAFKFSLKQLLFNYPSPKRYRELAVAEARKKLIEGQNPSSASAAKTVTTQKGPASGYQQGPSKEKSTTDRLSQLLLKGQK